MHELSIAMGIVKIAESETSKAKARKVECIELEIGNLAGVELEALEFVWPSAVRGTVLDQAELKIHRIEGMGKCADCDLEFHLENYYDPCPNCNSFLKSILKGKELRVKALEVS